MTRSIWVPIAVLLLHAGCGGCGPPPVLACDGCVGADGQCHPGTAREACGGPGEACQPCGESEVCASQACVSAPHAAISPVEPLSIDPMPDAGAADGGLSCASDLCTGCCVNGSCVPIAAQDATACGHSREQCLACAADQRCESGQCVRDVPADCLVFAPDELDFRNVALGCSVSRPVRLYNLCPSLVIESIALRSSGPFSLEGLPALPAGIVDPASYGPDAGVPLDFRVRFAPRALGLDSAELEVRATHAPAPTTYRFRVSGNGTIDGRTVDEFPLSSRADVLLVVDLSCSAAEPTNWFRGHPSALLAGPRERRLDFHLAAIPTEAWRPKLLGAPGEQIMTAGSPSEQLGAIIPPGGLGSALEEVFLPPVRALTAPALTSHNAGFLRSSASLGVLFFTDSGDPLPPRFVVDVLRSVKGYRAVNAVTVNAIGPMNPTPPDGCLHDGNPELIRVFAEAATSTGGVTEDICALSPSSVERVGRAAFGERREFFVLGSPGPGAPAVQLNGQVVPAQDPAGHPIWSWDAEKGSITFVEGFTPQPGSTVRLEYTQACETP